MRIELMLEPHLSAAEMVKLGRMAEHYGIAGVWVPNNIASRDPFVNFVPLAEQTTRLRIGPAAVSPFELHPVRMANQLLTFNEISAGRGQIVVGAGGGTLEAMGIKPQRMVRAVRECVEMLRQAASGKPGGYKGEIFRMAWLDSSWVRAQPPAIYVGANAPQMLRMGARCGDGIMISDFTPGRVGWARQIVDPVLREAGRDPATFPFNNAWAWHVKDSAEAAQREARIFLTVRGTIWEPYVHDVLGPAEAALVISRQAAFVRAYQRKSPEVEGVPEDVMRRIVDHGVSASPVAEIDREIERLREFARAGLSTITLILYGDAAEAIRVIGEKVVPAVTATG
jgi:alkanesulfonate monooxygenase SsuD/methylene tetrahydromethanopterin reductase-like flavin-dependent oxidoreductase (luciferase family)